MAAHLFKDENEYILPRQTIGRNRDREGFENDLVQMQLYTRMTEGDRGIFHVAINPRQYEQLTPEQHDRALEIIEQKFGLSDQPRMQIDHVKEGRVHTHVFWSTVDQEKAKLIDLPHYKLRLQDCAAQMEKEFEHETTIRQTNEKTYEITNAERMAAQRTGRKAMVNKEEITAAWTETETWTQFTEKLQEKGYTIAKGERCKYALIDPKGQVCNLVRQLPKTINHKHVAERVGAFRLPGLEEAKEQHHHRHVFNKEAATADSKHKTARDNDQGCPKSTIQKNPLYKGLSAEDATKRGLNHFLERQSAVSEDRFVRHMISNGPFTKDQIQGALKKDKQTILAGKDGKQFITTTQAVKEEKKLIDYAKKGQSTQRPLNASYTPKQSFLNEGQKRAIDHTLNSKDQVIVISGGAGVGKTSLMKEVKQGIEEQGKTLHAFAPSANASRGVLREKGFEDANTIAALLKSKKMQEQTRGGVILIDEAGMVGNKTMNRIFKVAEEHKARVILSGDWRQHNSPEAGDALRIIEQKTGLKVGHVNEIVRQKNEAYKQAVDQLAQGKVSQGFEQLDQMGTITEIVDDKKRYNHVADDYIASLNKERTALVVSPTHGEGRAVSAVIRQKLKEQGFIDQKEHRFTTHNSLSLTQEQKRSTRSYQVGMSIQMHGVVEGFERGQFYDVSGRNTKGAVVVRGKNGKFQLLPIQEAEKFQVFQREQTDIATGDILRVTGNGQTLEGEQVNNGENHTVAGFDAQGNIQLANGQTLSKDYRNFSLGYYNTSHASQGKDAQDVLIVQSSKSFVASNDKQFYVSVSRGEERCRIYTDDKEGLKKAVNKSGDRMTAGEVVELSPQYRFNEKAKEPFKDNVVSFPCVEETSEDKPSKISSNDNEKASPKKRSWTKHFNKQYAKSLDKFTGGRKSKKEKTRNRDLDIEP
ncbi:MAG: AAA family ATPase [Bacteroidota bacterium]